MRRIFVSAVVISVLLAGCKSRESQVIGMWKSPEVSFTFYEDKTYKQVAAQETLEGTWSFADDKVSAMTKMANGQPIEQVVQTLKTFKDDPRVVKQLEQAGTSLAQIEDLVTHPTVLTLSPDATSLSRQNPITGQSLMLTKSP
jgi:hypothetical protein